MLERLRLGQHTLLHNPHSQALILAEDAACEALDRPDAAAAHPTLANWRAAGLFDDKPYIPEICVPRIAATGNRILTFKGPAGRAAIALPDGVLYGQIAGLLSFCREHQETATVADYGIATDGARYTAYDHAGPLTESITLDEARFFAIRALCETLYGETRVAAVLHGAAVARDGTALLLLGQSGSGKTTTALGLLDAGCQLLADDFAPIHTSGHDVLAFPTPLGLKGTTRSLPEARSVKATIAPGLRAQVQYVSPHAALTLGTRMPVIGIVFARYEQGQPYSLDPLTPEDAFVAAISEGGKLNARHGSAAPLVRLFNTVPAWELRFNRSDQSVPACLSLFAKASNRDITS